MSQPVALMFKESSLTYFFDMVMIYVVTDAYVICCCIDHYSAHSPRGSASDFIAFAACGMFPFKGLLKGLACANHVTLEFRPLSKEWILQYVVNAEELSTFFCIEVVARLVRFSWCKISHLTWLGMIAYHFSPKVLVSGRALVPNFLAHRMLARLWASKSHSYVIKGVLTTK